MFLKADGGGEAGIGIRKALGVTLRLGVSEDTDLGFDRPDTAVADTSKSTIDGPNFVLHIVDRMASR